MSAESCSECKFEIIQKRWTELLLNWINKCVKPEEKVISLTSRVLVDVVNKYRNDICTTDLDRALLFTDDLEPYLRYKYPILRLRYFSEDKDIPRKVYVMASVIMFHCCISSVGGAVVMDICQKLTRSDQEMVVKFCERLGEMEVTVNNLDCAIRDAYDAVMKGDTKFQKSSIFSQKTVTESSDEVSESNIMICNRSSIGPESSQRSKKYPILKFKSSVTVLPSCVTDTSSHSKISLQPESSVSTTSDCTFTPKTDEGVEISDSNEVMTIYNLVENVAVKKDRKDNVKEKPEESSDAKPLCKQDCACTRCSVTGPCCGVPGSSVTCDNPQPRWNKWMSRLADHKDTSARKDMRLIIMLGVVILVSLLIATIIGVIVHTAGKSERTTPNTMRLIKAPPVDDLPDWAWECKKGICEKTYQPEFDQTVLYLSLSRCTLLCMGPQIWPHPIGFTHFSKELVALSTNKLEYKFQSIPSDIVSHYLSDAFKLFLGDLVKLENVNVKRNNRTNDIAVIKMFIQIDVETDPDPRLKINTDESYNIKIDSTVTQLNIFITSSSFCGVRHGLETLSQLIVLDQSSGSLITLSKVIIKDAPSYKYRGLMIDTGRNYIPVPDLIRTVDAMAMCKLNTFHWRITDSTSFPLFLPKLSNLFEYGAYDRSMIYTKEDITKIVNRAAIRGIRVLIEVAAPGPVGRAWSWSSDGTCRKKNDNHTCNNQLCLQLKMQESVFDMLQHVYAEIIQLTAVDDIFHLSDSMFSFMPCYFMLEERDGFLERALDRLRLANGGFVPKLPIVWYTAHLKRDLEERVWDRLGVQLNDWNPPDVAQSLSRYRVIHSSKWDLSCEIKKHRCQRYKTWQEMYSWKSWRTVDVFSIEGGEAVLWTDLVDSGNLDYHLWPRTAAVAERLWSDIMANKSASPDTYTRLDNHRWHMLVRGLKVQPVWPLWCSFNPAPCLQKIPR